MKLKSLYLLASLAIFSGLYSCKTEEKKESAENPPIVSNSDFSNSRSIDLGFPIKDSTLTIDSANTGGGMNQEFNADSATIRHMFSAEDNSDWYKITSKGDTAISFTIKPKDSSTELDFVLFRGNQESISADLKAGTIKALRSNFSKVQGDGSTGLACDARLGFHVSDTGTTMSRAFVIRKDQIYYLVVNAKSSKNSGYDLSFHACSPGEGGLSDFEGSSENPENEGLSGQGSNADSESGTQGNNTAGNGEESSSDISNGSSEQSEGKNGNASSGKSGKGAGLNGGSKGQSTGKNGNASSGKSGKGAGLSGGTSGKSSGKNGKAGAGKNSGKTEVKSEYVVGEKETLFSIAFKMGMTVEELMALNGMKDTNVYPGQKLIVISRELSQKSIDQKLANSKPVKPSPSKTGSTTDPKEIIRLRMEKAAADAAKKKAIADQLKAKAAAAKAVELAKAAELAKAGKGAGVGNTSKTNPSNTSGKGNETAGQGANAQGGKTGEGAGNNQAGIDPMKSRNSADPITGRNPNFNPTPNFPVNNPTINKGVETSNSLAPADKSFYIYCNVTSGVNKNPVGGVLQVVDLKKKDLVYNVQANKTQPVPLFNAGGKQKLLICDIFGYKKQDFDLNLDNIINDSTAQQVQIVDDTIVINFELRRLEKGDVAVAYNIFFYDDASVMLPKSTYELDQLLELMVENKKIKVKIHGHTNTSKLGKILYLDKGDKTFFRLTAKNKETFGPAKMLSKKRAETIKMYLESKRITDDRIETEGHGGSQMLYPNTHPLAFKNKRVEVEILEDK